jgi:ElaB/YqjD/DUF883 family membrane-anchored ribosome-binding protein
VEVEEVIRLEDLKNLLNRHIEDLRLKKQRLDRFASIIKRLDEKEEAFKKLLSKLENLNMEMLSYFDTSDISKDIRLIEGELQKIKFEYEQKEVSIRKELTNSEFNEEAIDRYYRDVSTFLDERTELMDDLARRQREIFSESMKKIRDELTIVNRLIDVFTKKVEGLPKGGELRRHLSLIRERVERLESDLPSKVEDLEKIHKSNTEMFKGLYEKTKSEITSLKEELQKFVVKNELIGKEEMTIFEALHVIAHEMKRHTFEFNEALELLRKKVLRASDEELQDLLLSLSKKSFLILTLAIR